MRSWIALAVMAVPLGAASLSAEVAPAVESVHHAEVLLGEVTVLNLTGGRTAVIVDEFDAAEPDGTAERVFILQSEVSVQGDFPLQIPAAELVFRKDSLSIMSLGEPRAIGLFLLDSDPTEVEKQLALNLLQRYGHTNVEAITLLSGYGLTEHRGEFPLPMEAWPPMERPAGSFRQKLSEGDFTAQANCRSGGPGTQICDIDCPLETGCGVVCYEGYYACCNCTWGTPDCKCVPNSQCGLHPCEP